MLQRLASVSWRWGCVLVQRMVLLVPLKYLQLRSGVLNNGVNFFNIVKTNIVNFRLLACQHVFELFQYFYVSSFEHILS